MKKVIDDTTRRVNRDGKADSDGTARRAIDHRVDPDDLAAGVEQGTARVARIDRGVGLDDPLDQPIGKL